MVTRPTPSTWGQAFQNLGSFRSAQWCARHVLYIVLEVAHASEETKMRIRSDLVSVYCGLLHFAYLIT
jgi:hypothetical protein